MDRGTEAQTYLCGDVDAEKVVREAGRLSASALFWLPPGDARMERLEDGNLQKHKGVRIWV